MFNLQSFYSSLVIFVEGNEVISFYAGKAWFKDGSANWNPASRVLNLLAILSMRLYLNSVEVNLRNKTVEVIIRSSSAATIAAA